MGYEHLSVSTVNHVMRVTLDRPEVLNAINVKMHEELQIYCVKYFGSIQCNSHYMIDRRHS